MYVWIKREPTAEGWKYKGREKLIAAPALNVY
jgi:hypothetical protein